MIDSLETVTLLNRAENIQTVRPQLPRFTGTAKYRRREQIRNDAYPIRWTANRVRSSNGRPSAKVRRSSRQAAISSAGRRAAC